MTSSRFKVAPIAQHDYKVLGAARPSGAQEAARAALDKARGSRPSEAVHVTQRKDGWAVKVEGSERASSVQATKAKAIDVARTKAQAQGARLIEHGMDGRILRNTKPVSRPRQSCPTCVPTYAGDMAKAAGTKVYVSTRRSFPDSFFISRSPLSNRGRRPKA